MDSVLKTGDTITCRDIQDTTDVLAVLDEAGYGCIVMTDDETRKLVIEIVYSPYEAKEAADG